jgi:dimethylhistidine N-methyltransferase
MKDLLQQEIILGLQSNPPIISPKFFYDEMGSKLFEAITLLDEYYPTRIEQELMAKRLPEMARAIGEVEVLIELGAGNCQKARAVLDMLQPKEYLALDISKDFLETAISELRKEYPQVEIRAIEADISKTLSFPELQAKTALFFYPGSSIGNFEPSKVLSLFSNLAQICRGMGGLLIGVDLMKDHAVLERAYNDPLGITAAFNRNALLHINRLIGSNFSIHDWEHHSLFNPNQSRIEMHLRAKRDVQISWSNRVQLQFRAGDLIHTENSYKYEKLIFIDLLKQAGFTKQMSWTDPQNYFLVCFAGFQ